MTHRDGFPRVSARSAWRGDAGHRKPCATPSESLGKPPFRSGMRNAGGRRKTLTMPWHRRRLPSYPADRPRDLYESLSTLLGIIPRVMSSSRRNRFAAVLIFALAAALAHPAASRATGLALAANHVAEIDRKIAGLRGMRDTLTYLMERCHGDDRPECPILDALGTDA